MPFAYVPSEGWRDVAPKSFPKFYRPYSGRARETTAAAANSGSRQPETLPKPKSDVEHQNPFSMRQCNDNQAIYERMGCLGLSARRQSVWVDLEAQLIERDSEYHPLKPQQDGTNAKYWQSRAKVLHGVDMALTENGG